MGGRRKKEGQQDPLAQGRGTPKRTEYREAGMLEEAPRQPEYFVLFIVAQRVKSLLGQAGLVPSQSL